MKNTVCYVVECSSGSYDDYRTWISGIFLDASDAENLKTQIETRIENTKNIPCPFKEEDLGILSDEQSSSFYKWWEENNKAMEFNGVTVTEIPLNKFIE